jgi:hypothetical protein
LNAVTYGDDRYVAVGRAGGIVTSNTGREWSPAPSGVEEWLFGATYNVWAKLSADAAWMAA